VSLASSLVEVSLLVMRRVVLAALAATCLAGAACGGDDERDVAPTVTQAAATSTRPPPTATVAATSTSEPEITEAAPTEAAPTAPPATAAAPTPAPPTPAPRVDALSVAAADFSFSPSALSVSRGSDTVITLSNTGVAPHSMKVFRDAGYTDAVAGAETPSIDGGASAAFTLASADVGTSTQLFFLCTVHPNQMEGTIAVQ
jgi:hypothetical protein